MDTYTRRCRPALAQTDPGLARVVEGTLLDLAGLAVRSHGPARQRPARPCPVRHSGSIRPSRLGPVRPSRLGPVRPSRLAISGAPTLSFAPVVRRPPAYLLADARCRETASQLSGRACMVTSLPPGWSQVLEHSRAHARVACAHAHLPRTPQQQHTGARMRAHSQDSAQKRGKKRSAPPDTRRRSGRFPARAELRPVPGPRALRRRVRLCASPPRYTARLTARYQRQAVRAQTAARAARSRLGRQAPNPPPSGPLPPCRTLASLASAQEPAGRLNNGWPNNGFSNKAPSPLRKPRRAPAQSAEALLFRPARRLISHAEALPSVPRPHPRRRRKPKIFITCKGRNPQRRQRKRGGRRAGSHPPTPNPRRRGRRGPRR